MPEWLTVAGQLILGAGLLSAIVAYLLQRYEESRRRKRELQGLLRLVLLEISMNDGTVALYTEDLRLFQIQPLGAALQTSYWDESRARIAQLMNDPNRFASVAKYYVYLAAMRLSATHMSLREGSIGLPTVPAWKALVDAYMEAAAGANEAIQQEINWTQDGTSEDTSSIDSRE